MGEIEATVEILKSALENNAISFESFSNLSQEEIEKQNAFNRKQIEDFITSVYKTLYNR